MSQKIFEALAHATRFLNENSNRDARRDANLLLAHVLNRDLTFLIAHNDEFLSLQENEQFWRLIERRASGEPLQYIVGKQEFFELEFEVNKNVLIPRPETEFLVEAALEILRAQKNKFFCDVGTGSGCIAVSILKNVPNASAVIVDISPQALNLAQTNASKHKVLNNLQSVRSDCFDTFDKIPLLRNAKFSVIVSNPPYIPIADSETLQREVRDHEPHDALFSGKDGLDVVRKLLNQAPQYLHKNGWLLFEIGFKQSDQMHGLIDKKTWKLKEIRADLQGIPRIVVLQKEC